MLKDMQIGKEFEETVFVISAAEKTNKNGKKYYTGELKDRSGTFKYYLWDSDNIAFTLPKKESYVKIKARIDLFNDNPQVTISHVVNLDPGTIDPADFIKVSEHDIKNMWDEFIKFIQDMKDPFIQTIANRVVADINVSKYFKTAPAAQTVHNAWIGGLLEHSLAVAKLVKQSADFYNKNYFNGKLNKDIAVFGALFHDVGKIWDYDTKTPGIKVTVSGELLGHIYMGARKIGEIAREYIHEQKDSGSFTSDIHDKVNAILHIILSHHGKLEWGSPVNPKTPEAILVHYLDNVDTKIMNAWENLKDCKDEFTSKIYIQENVRLYNTMKD